MASKNNSELFILEKNLTLPKAIEGTKIKVLEKSIGEINIVKAISFLILRFSENINVSNNITEIQSMIISQDIIEKYPYETIEDVFLMLKQARQGIIGDGKDYKVDGQTILAKWFPQYLDNKYQEVEKIHKEMSNPKNEIVNNAVDQYYAKIHREKAFKEQRKKVELEIDAMVKNMDKQMLEDTILDWERKDDMKPFLPYLKLKRKLITK